MAQTADYSSMRTKYPFDAQRSGFLSPKIVEKPWGREEWIVATQHYAMKRLTVGAGHVLSVQYHPRKMKSLIVVEGSCIVLLGEEGAVDKRNLKEHVFRIGDVLHLNPRTVHTLRAVTDVVLMEVSTPHLTDMDTVRLEDAYGRT